jgi:hypothetical protein
MCKHLNSDVGPMPRARYGQHEPRPGPPRGEIVVQLDRRTYSPVLRQADLPPTVTVPWWGGRRLRYHYA